MRLARIGKIGLEQPCVLDPKVNKLVLLSGFCRDFDAAWLKDDGFNELQKLFVSILAGNDGLPRIGMEDVGRFGAPIVPAKIRCIGQNYAKHAKEANMAEPEEPAVFNKDADSLAGPYDPLQMPPGVEMELFWRPNPKEAAAVKGMPKGCLALDYEVEKAFVTRQPILGLRPEEVADNLSRYILGYVAMNDVSQRDWQLRSIGGLWDLGKSGRGWAAFAPFLVTSDEITDANNLRLWSKVNGEGRQSSNTSDMIHKDPYILAYLSQFGEVPPMTVVSTGTPEGVGMVKGYLKIGDEVEWGIEGFGPSGKHRVVTWNRT